MKPTLLTVAPTVLPVTVAELKAYAKIDTTDEDSFVTSLIEAMTDRAESRTGRQLVEATRKLYLDDFPPEAEIEIPCPPLQSVTTVKYRDTDGDWQTLTENTDYIVDTNGGGATPEDKSGVGRIYLPKSVTWPAVYDEPRSVEIVFVCGYPLSGTTATTPEAIKNWIKVQATTAFNSREALVTGTIVSPIPSQFIDGLLTQYRVRWDF